MKTNILYIIYSISLKKDEAKMIFPHRRSSKKKSESTHEPAKTDDYSDRNQISDDLDENINNIKATIGSSDLIINLSKSHPDRHIRFASLYIDNLISNQILSIYSAELGKILISVENMETKNSKEFFNLLINQFSSFRRVSQGSSLDKVMEGLLSGELVFLIDGYSIFLSIDAYSPEGR